MSNGYVYFALDDAGSRMKIGYSLSPIDRITQLRYTEHVALRLVGVCPGSHKTEKQFHQRFQEHLANKAEWFNVTQEIMELAESFAGGLAGLQSDQMRRQAAISTAARKSKKRFRGAAKELASEIGVSVQYLSDVRHRRRKISLAVLERIAELETK